MPQDLTFLDATEQAALVRRGEVQPIELVDAAIARIERIDPALRSVVAPLFEEARAQARTVPAGAAFPGVPMLLKDLGAPCAGAPLTCGMRFLRDAGWREPEDSYFTARLRAAGFCFVGRSSSPELGLLPTTEPEAYGPTHNPWSLAHSPGGSSGGSAAAVAAGLVPVAHASDGGGSIRIPASACALVGLKPTRARSSFGPGVGERWAGLSCEHVLTRSVRDAAAILDVVAGPMPGDPYFAPPPERPFASFLEPGPRLRIGLMAERSPRGGPVDPACREAAERAARSLERLGHRIEPGYPDALDDASALEALVEIIAANVAFALDAWAGRVGGEIGAGDVEPLTWALAERGRARSAAHYLAAIDRAHRFGRALARWWEGGWDLLLTPTTAAPSPRLGEMRSTRAEPFRGFARAAPYGAFTSPFNLSGQPAISLPVHWTDEGLPVGAQLVAGYGREDLLLSVAAELERELPWCGRRPPIA